MLAAGNARVLLTVQYLYILTLRATSVLLETTINHFVSLCSLSLLMMASSNPFNVYLGSDSVRDYYNPDLQPPLPLVELPDVLNPYRDEKVRIYAKMMTMHPANNVKAYPDTWLQPGDCPRKDSSS